MIRKGAYCIPEVVTAVSRKLYKNRHWSLHKHEPSCKPHNVFTGVERSVPKEQERDRRSDASEQGHVQ